MSPDNVAVRRTEVDPAEWDAFVDASDEAWLWHRHAMQDALATWAGRQDLSFAVRERPGGQLIAVMPLHVVETPRLRRLPFVRLNSLGGRLLPTSCRTGFAKRIVGTVTEEVLRSAGQRRTTRIDVALAPLAPAYRGDRCPRVNPPLGLGMSNTLTETGVVDCIRGWKRRGRPWTAGPAPPCEKPRRPAWSAVRRRFVSRVSARGSRPWDASTSSDSLHGHLGVSARNPFERAIQLGAVKDRHLR